MACNSNNVWEELIYRQGRQINRWPYTNVVSRVNQLLASALPADARVLELGCGTGNNLRFLAEEGLQAFGIDASKTAIELAGQQLAVWGLDAQLEVGTFTSLPYENETFDLVIDRAAVVHNECEVVVQALKETHRVLKPDAHFLSFGLKGVNHPDRVYGTPVGPHTWSHFSAGTFVDAGPTCFFHPENIGPLFSEFSEVEWQRHRITGPNGDIRDEEFEIRAKK